MLFWPPIQRWKCYGLFVYGIMKFLFRLPNSSLIFVEHTNVCRSVFVSFHWVFVSPMLACMYVWIIVWCSFIYYFLSVFFFILVDDYSACIFLVCFSSVWLCKYIMKWGQKHAHTLMFFASNESARCCFWLFFTVKVLNIKFVFIHSVDSKDRRSSDLWFVIFDAFTHCTKKIHRETSWFDRLDKWTLSEFAVTS